MKKTKEWFGDWFDSPFYHILYKHRDENEAHFFIDQLIKYLQIKKSSKILDLACGKGRHAFYLNKQGFDVTGVDLSFQNIYSAKLYENERLHFYLHDMRQAFCNSCFDYIFNIFTSFGYFESEEENQKTITAIAEALKEDGIFMLDFLNPSYTRNNLTAKEEKRINGIHFKISRRIFDGYIIKEIQFTHEGVPYSYQEKVQLLSMQQFKNYFFYAGLEVINVFGNYQLEDYFEEASERMIFVTKKNQKLRNCDF